MNMKITTIINEFESNFASSFIHTALVKYEVAFKTSVISDIQNNLLELKAKVKRGESKDVHVGWEMTIDHIEMLEKYLKIIIKAYDEHFFMNPNNLKVYSVNQKLREVETPNLKDFTIDVLKGLTINTEKKKLTRSQRVKQEADLYVKKWALGQIKLGKKSA